jgi:predicted Zn finger-like uncharacterized protein
MGVRVSCPHCSQVYCISEEKLGKQTTCKKCNQRFTLAVDAPVDPVAEQPSVAEPEPQPTGFLARLKSGIKSGVEDLKRKVDEATERQLAARAAADAQSYAHPSVAVMPSVKFITGPIDLKPNTGLYFDVHDGDIVLLKLRAEITLKQKCDPVLRFPLASVKHLEIETAERMSLGRVGAGLLLAGPLGAVFGGFGFKKKDRLLRIDFDDAGMEASIILGGGNVQVVNNKILTARRDAVRNSATGDDAAT